MNVVLSKGWTRLEIKRRHSGLVSSSDVRERIDVRSTEQALSHLRPFALDSGSLGQLRALGAQLGGGGWQQSNDEVLRQIAAALRDGVLTLYRSEVERPQRTAAAAADSAAYVEAPPRRPPVSEPAPLPPPSRAPLPGAAAAPAPADTMLDNIDHDAQAATLESAARDGVPFCAACERAAAQARQQEQATA